ncbi:MAG TPA: dTMP kinase [Bacilli bacterium]
MKTGKFITFEGGEGAGKTSVISMVSSYFTSAGYDVLVTREPGGIEIAEQIREIILDQHHIRMDGRTEALLYAAARRQHLVEKIIPNLQQDKIILCDRFIDSSLAYQGHARGLGIQEVWKINEFAIDGMMPDMTFFLDILPETGLARIHADKNREINRLDAESVAFHHHVREGYFQLLELFPERMMLINAERSLDMIFEEIIERIHHRILEE